MYNPGIEAFLAVVRTQNLSRAAIQLNLAQSTVSKRLKVLEQEIGTILFERGKGYKNIRLTPAGEAFITIAERWDSLLRETQILHSGGPQLSLSILTLDSLINSTFPALYRALSHHEPKIRLKIVTSHSVEAYEEVERRQVDVAFSLLERTHPNVVVEKCYTEPMVVLQVASSPQAEPQIIHPQELDPNQELYVRWGPGFQIWHDKWWNPSLHGQKQLDTAQLLLLCLQEAKQWAIMPLSVAKRAQASGKHAIFYLSEPPPDRIVYKLTHRYPKASTEASLKIFDHYVKIVIQDEFELPKLP
jgi:DNA-binding transcriptional LysR family regulator